MWFDLNFSFAYLCFFILDCINSIVISLSYAHKLSVLCKVSVICSETGLEHFLISSTNLHVILLFKVIFSKIMWLDVNFPFACLCFFILKS